MSVLFCYLSCSVFVVLCISLCVFVFRSVEYIVYVVVAMLLLCCCYLCVPFVVCAVMLLRVGLFVLCLGFW